MDEQRSIGIGSLPPELLYNIFSLLDRAPPSVPRLYDQPSYEITHSSVLDLKSASRVSQFWRQATLPLLFRHTRMLLEVNTILDNWPTLMQEFLDFVRENDLEWKVESFTVAVRDQHGEVHGHNGSLEFGPRSFLHQYWERLFNVLKPLRLTIVAPPLLLGVLVGISVDTNMADEFYMPYHIFSLSRSLPSAQIQQPESIIKYKPWATLLYSPCWDSLLLNEGSFMRPYSTNDYLSHISNPPSVLSILENERPDFRVLLADTITSVSYIAVFPPRSHIRYLSILSSRLERIYIQFVPRHDLTLDNWQRGNADVMTINAERELTYQSFLDEAFSVYDPHLTLSLRDIECGDATDDPTWKELVGHAIEADPKPWRTDPEREGALIRNLK